jgi:hypothetical protein
MPIARVELKPDFSSGENKAFLEKEYLR